MTLPAGLLAAYDRTEYRVDDRGHTFVLRIGHHSRELAACHAAFGVRCSTFLTAWNPRSQPTPRDVNERALASLTRDVEARGLTALRGIGIDPDGEWEGEPSLLVLGLAEVEARQLALAFDQNAIVVSDEDAVPFLVVVV